ncbi:hypothetical protein [Leifsonia sp. Leaf264]|uniref:hypothetical protein n=1 Tax=Leifsonia sp. Leaf264 TaxID=1736314 RepID=UPI0006FFCD64|nr:hypothetical protein [Leifsonia sp. Leaf264]KQO98527.1 hypothetical protein ASF30_10725 [Leifsonia sp. Leaf264]
MADPDIPDARRTRDEAMARLNDVFSRRTRLLWVLVFRNPFDPGEPTISASTVGLGANTKFRDAARKNTDVDVEFWLLLASHPTAPEDAADTAIESVEDPEAEWVQLRTRRAGKTGYRDTEQWKLLTTLEARGDDGADPEATGRDRFRQLVASLTPRTRNRRPW